MINYYFENIEAIEIEESIILWLENLLSFENKKLGKINYIFCSDEYLLSINKSYLQHDYYTDIITFNYVKSNTISADIFVSLPRISENATSYAKNFDDELRRVLAHGLLHLCGYNDKTEEEQKEMRKKEDFYLNRY